MRLAIIGGTGVYHLKAAHQREPIRAETAYGSIEVSPGEMSGHEVFFLPRHGTGHTVPPHRINYRANIAGLKQLGCTVVIATNAVGSLRESLPPASMLIPDQFIDFTRERPLTFFDGDEGVKHVDMTEPYCPTVRQWVAAAVADEGETYEREGTYLGAEGPRFETPAEIRMFAQWGADVVGMTGLPEVVLAREAGLCYASLCLVTNFAAGISPTPLSHREVTELMDEWDAVIERVLASAVSRAAEVPDCPCRQPIT